MCHSLAKTVTNITQSSDVAGCLLLSPENYKEGIRTGPLVRKPVKQKEDESEFDLLHQLSNLKYKAAETICWIINKLNKINILSLQLDISNCKLNISIWKLIVSRCEFNRTIRKTQYMGVVANSLNLIELWNLYIELYTQDIEYTTR